MLSKILVKIGAVCGARGINILVQKIGGSCKRNNKKIVISSPYLRLCNFSGIGKQSGKIHLCFQPQYLVDSLN
jgi:hypothetical protein